jgi:DNA-binding MarR family transcriptional regulator
MRLRGAYLTLHRCLNLRLRQSGLTADQFVVLSLVAREEGLTQGEIARRCASDPSTVGALLRLLEKEKLISRERHAKDGRALSIRMTERGRRMQQAAWDVSKDWQRTLGETLPAGQEAEVVLATLDHIRESMTAQMAALSSTATLEVRKAGAL